MKVKILNKNNNAVYEVDEAPIFTETYNETLDTGTVIISNQSNKIIMEPYDIVEILYDDNTRWKYMCIDTYTEMMTCVNPKIYRYEISLFSETKQLEGTILPNLKITKVWGETRYISQYILQYMNEYCPKIRIENGSSFTYKEKWTYKTLVGTQYQLITKLQNKFGNVECPEMQWNTPTLREVLNDLMMVVDCIPIIKNGTLDYIDLTEISSTDWSDDISHINYVSKSKSSEDYVSELQVNLVNVTNKDEGINNIVNRIEYVPFTANDNEGTMNSNNILLKTKYSIYKLKSVKLMVPLVQKSQYDVIGKTYWFEQDLMDITENGTTFSLISEYQEWITKQIDYLNMFNSSSPAHLSEWKNYQNWSLYYTRGTNIITNFNSQQKYAITTIVWWEEFMNKLVQQVQGFPPGAGPYNYPNAWYGVSTNYYDLVFKVEYETLEGCLFRASKGESPEHERVVIDNQTNSYVDSFSQGFLEYQKANRLGNEQLHINARFLSTETPMVIAETYDDTVIYQCQYQIFKNHTEVNALATKNYILREYFTGVKSKIRSWRIASGSEALTRHDLLKYYCEFSFSLHQDRELDILGLNDVSTYFTSPLVSYTTKPLKVAFVRTKYQWIAEGHANETWYPSANRYYVLDLLSRICGNSLVFTIAFDDNYLAGKSFDTSIISTSSFDFSGSVPHLKSSALKGGGIPMAQHRYVNDNGENSMGYIVFGDGIKVTAESYADVESGDRADDTYRDKTYYFLYNIYKRPVVETANVYGTYNGESYNYEKIIVDFHFKKDSQEITNISTQFEFCSDTIDICFSKEWLRKQISVSTNDNSGSFYLNLYPEDSYDFRNPNKLPTGGSAYNSVTVDVEKISNLNSLVKFQLSGTYQTELEAKQAAERFVHPINNNVESNMCLYLVDNNNKPLLALNNIPKSNCVAISEEIEDDLPDTYERLEFIQNSGTQYLNLGFVPNTNEWWNFSLDYTDVAASGSNYVMGSRVGTGTIYFGVTGASATKAITIACTNLSITNNYRKANRRYQVSASYSGNDNGTCGLYNVTDDEFYDGEQNVNLSGATANVCLFALQAGNIHSGMKVHSLKVYKGGNLFRDLVPARRISDNVLGMYDLVNNVFYTNAGTGTFIAGSVVPGGTVYHPGIIFYLNILRNRNKNIYDSDNPYLIVNKI